MKLKRQIGAKLNLTLDIVGEKNGFHQLKSLVVELSIKDTVVIKGRKDDEVTLKVKGASLPVGEKNTAFKAGKAFVDRYLVPGVDITVIKKIPLGGGLGGSSADIAGVLSLMKEYYDIDGDLSSIASSLGSDVYYMINGGTAILEGKGERVSKIKSSKKLYFLLALAKNECLSKDAYLEYDNQGITYPESTGKAVEYYSKGDINSLIKVMKNDLTPASTTLVKEIKDNLKALSVTGNAFMTGSGSVTFSLFESKKERDKWYNKLKKSLTLIKAESV